MSIILKHSVKPNHNKEEILDSLKKYFYHNNTFQAIKDFSSEENQLLFDFCEYCELFHDEDTALPDGIFQIKDKQIIVEHFKIDASKRTREGSRFNKIYAFFPEIKDYTVFNFKQENLVTNFVDSCNRHYSQFQRYKNAINIKLGSDANNMPIWFFVEDVTPYGSDFTIDDMSENFRVLLNCLNPINCVDYLFYFMMINGQPKRFVVSKRQIKLYNEQNISSV